MKFINTPPFTGLFLPLLAACGLLALLACKDASSVTPDTPAKPTSLTVVSSTTVTSPATATTATVGVDSAALSGSLRQIVQVGLAGSQTTTFGYAVVNATLPAQLTSYTTISGLVSAPDSQTTLAVSLIRTGTQITSQRENLLVGNSLISVQRSFSYNVQGQLIAVDLGSDYQERYTYNEAGKLVGWQRLAGTPMREVSRAAITWQLDNVRLVRYEDTATRNVDEATWQADNLPNYRRRITEQLGLPLRFDPGISGADLLSVNNPGQVSELFSGRRLRYTYTVGSADRLAQRIVAEWIGGQWVTQATENYRYY
ncbi:hypothetical protein [uncultured Fibrella sp.]|uniref:hypothetical protein n=1 Tax=uncultured Fibrella sp. TaxID=1284596 RepID=UPI0035C96256